MSSNVGKPAALIDLDPTSILAALQLAKFKLSHSNGQIYALLALDRERLQREIMFAVTNQRIGPDTDTQTGIRRDSTIAAVKTAIHSVHGRRYKPNADLLFRHPAQS